MLSNPIKTLNHCKSTHFKINLDCLHMLCIVAPLWCSDRNTPTNTYICNEVNSKNKCQWARFTNALPQSKTFFGYCQDLLKCHSVSVVTERDTGIFCGWPYTYVYL